MLSWKDADEDAGKPKSVDRVKSRDTEKASPKRLFSQSFIERPVQDLGIPPKKPKVHFLDMPYHENTHHIPKYPSQPPNKPIKATKRSCSQQHGPIFACHDITPTSIELPSQVMEVEAKVEYYNAERKITQLKFEQAKVTSPLNCVEARRIRQDL